MLRKEEDIMTILVNYAYAQAAIARAPLVMERLSRAMRAQFPRLTDLELKRTIDEMAAHAAARTGE